MAKQPKKLTRAQKILLDKIGRGEKVGMSDTRDADVLLGCGMVTFDRKTGKYAPTAKEPDSV